MRRSKTVVEALPRQKEATSRHIAADPERVWDLITTVSEVPNWYDEWESIESSSSTGRLSQGMSFQLTRNQIDSVQHAICHVTTAEAPAHLIWVECEPGRSPVTVEFRLEASPLGGTTLTHIKTWTEVAATPSAPPN